MLWEVGTVGRFEVERSKRQLVLKVSERDTPTFDRWTALLGFCLLYWVALTFAPWWMSWLLVSWVGMYLLRRASRKYARSIAPAESGFPRVREAVEFESKEEIDFTGGDAPYRSAPSKTPFSSLAIDGRKFPLTAVRSLRLVKWSDDQSRSTSGGSPTRERQRFAALVVELEDGQERLSYEVDRFEGRSGREALPLRNALAAFCHVQPGKSVVLADNQGLYEAPASRQFDNTILFLEVPLVAGMALLVGSMSESSPRLVPHLVGFVVIVVVDLLRTGRLVDAEARLRAAALASLRGRTRKGATVRPEPGDRAKD